MLKNTGILSLILSCVISQSTGLDLDISSQDSIKSAAKSLAGGIIKEYNNDLQTNGIPGIFPSPYYWWEAGAIWQGLIEYSHLTGDSQYDSLVLGALQWQTGDKNDFMPANQTKTLGNDDQSTWALAAVTASEFGFSKLKTGDWLTLARNVFDEQVVRWQAEEKNKTCGGGLRWQLFNFNNGYDYKSTDSNSNFFLLAARLAKLTGNGTYTQWAEKSFSWAKDLGFISDKYAVFDGASTTTNCSTINQIQWSYNLATYAEGSAIMYNITNGTQTWSDAVKGLVGSLSTFQNKSILTEIACENNGNCNVNQKAFKGIAARSLARAALFAPFVALPINQMLTASAQGAANACAQNGADISCNLVWTGGSSSSSSSVGNSTLSEVFSALQVVQALLWPQSNQSVSSSITPSSSNTPATSSTGSSQGAQHTAAGGRVVASFSTVVVVLGAVVVGLNI